LKIVCFGPGPQFKGGISNFNTSLAKALEKQGAEVHIVSWTNQYPSIIPREYLDKASKKNLLEGTGIDVKYITDYNNPFSWQRTYKYIKELNPDKVIIQWSNAVQGLPIGYITGKLSKATNAEIVFIMHNVKQKEPTRIDKMGIRTGLKHGDTFIVVSHDNANDLKNFFPESKFTVTETGERASDKSRTIIKLYHPIYDMFYPDENFNKENVKQELNLNKIVFLFFGFIRKYKGLHNIIRAFKVVSDKRSDVSLLIAGESFWKTLPEKKFSTRLKKGLFRFLKSILLPKSSDEQNYSPLALIEELNLQEKTAVVNRFIANEEVHKYFQVSDCIVLFYETDTPSGIESISYNFNLPVLATRVGHFPETVQDGFNGYLAEKGNVESMADAMLKFLEHPIPRENVAASTKQMRWENYARAIMRK
jgi:glycosyltransferase involved in cell wall biosynthesis